MSARRTKGRRWGLAALASSAALVLSGCEFSVYEIPLPGGADVGDNPYEVTVQFRDVLDLVPQSVVKVDDVTVGQTISIDDVFAAGDLVDVTGVSKGKGFAGHIKRHNFHRGPVSHGSHNVRAPGSIGASADPARVFKGIRGPGQMGNKRVTQRGLEVVDVRAEDNLLLVRGSVPGPKGSVVEIRRDGDR